MQRVSQDSQIKQTKLADLPAINAIEQLSHLQPWSQQTLLDCINHQDYACYLLQTRNTVNGFIIASFAANECQIQNICVAPEYRKQGHASALLEYLLAIAQTKKCTHVFLEVSQSNKPARQLYESFGFKKVGKRKSYYATTNGREDGIIYRLDYVKQ